ncbi:MAG: hypothetical protein HY438_02540 [DPANN group archaeon]|nr:hypothetical protein [DPANN group archaeon]
MVFERTQLGILGLKFNQDSLEGMTEFPSFYEPFLRLGNPPEREKRGKCMGERVDIPLGTYTLTEKVDGMNCAVVGWLSDSGPQMILRSRDKIVAYSEDWHFNDEHGIAEVLQPYIFKIQQYMTAVFPDKMWMLCLELYGGNIRPADYGAKKDVRQFAVRIFDKKALELFARAKREDYKALRRVNRYVPFLQFSEAERIALGCGLKTVPVIDNISSASLQTSEDVIALLNKNKKSIVAKENGGTANSEGLVMWHVGREDYTHPDKNTGTVMATFKLKFEDFPRGTFVF